MTGVFIVLEAIILGILISASVFVMIAFGIGLGSELNWQERFENTMNSITEFGINCGKQIKHLRGGDNEWQHPQK